MGESPLDIAKRVAADVRGHSLWFGRVSESLVRLEDAAAQVEGFLILIAEDPISTEVADNLVSALAFVRGEQ